MSVSPVPETSQRPDWPRLVAKRVNTQEGRIATLEAGGSTVQAVLDDVRGNIGIIASPATLYTGVSPLAVVASLSTANLANPAIADTDWAGVDVAPAIGTTIANQINRVRGQVGGDLSAQLTSILGSLAVTRKYPVTGGQTYTASLHNAPLDWTFYTNGFMQFFKTDGSFDAGLTSGFTLSADGRQLTFTVPGSGAKLWAVNLQYVSASNTNPVTTAQMTAAQNNLMLNTGSSAQPFAPYTTDDFAPTTANFTSAATKPIRLTQQGEFIYIRTACQQSANYDLMWRLRYGHGMNYFAVNSRSGVIDFYGQRFVAKATAGMVSAFNQATSMVHTNGIDESCPERRNGMFVDGNHGATCYQVTKAAHGMANVDVGSIWTDGTSQWMLLYIESASVLVFQRRYTGTNTKWVISSAAPASATFTHVSGATHTGAIAFTSPTAQQFVPIIRDQVQRVMVDGTAVVADGDYLGSSVWLEEVYTGLNIAKVQDALIAAVGAGSPNWTPDVGQSRVYSRYEWNKWGAVTIYTGRHVVDAYTRTALIDYWGGIQMQRLSLTGDSTPGMHTAVEMYIPDVGTVSGLNFKAKADITANVTDIQVMTANCDDPTKPSDMFCLLGKNGANYASGQAFGYDPLVGLGEFATRAAKSARVLNLSSANKCYPTAIDSAAGDAVAGDEFELACYRAPFLPTDAQLTIPGVIYSVNGGYRCLVSAHQTLTNKAVAVPVELSGKAVTVLASGGFTLVSPFVSQGVIMISTAGGHGWAILKIGS